jgi:acylphosphatase
VKRGETFAGLTGFRIIGGGDRTGHQALIVARRLLVSGRVQGVGFRWFTRDAATREGVSGWVRNLPDGRVEAFVEGEAEAVARVERAVRRGPRSARVETVFADSEPPSGALTGFDIK